MNNRIPPLDPAQATGKTQQLFTAIQGKMGMVPNALRVFGHSPAALGGYLNLNGALAGGVLPAAIREQISLAVSEFNGCGYCLSAHTVTGGLAGLSAEAITAARQGQATDAKAFAAITLARQVATLRGKVADADLAAARAAGLSDAELVEIVAAVVAITFTNYLNNVAEPVIDFPEVKPGVFA